jgi:hypothetical protein
MGKKHRAVKPAVIHQALDRRQTHAEAAINTANEGRRKRSAAGDRKARHL